jgi:hypothetical protein
MKFEDNKKEISLGEGFGDVAVKVNGIRLEVGGDGKSVKVIADTPVEISYAVNENSTSTALGAALKAHEVGDHLQDGTVVIAVDLKNNKALFAPEGIFGGEAKFDKQDAIPAQMNKQNAHGHNDWRRITNSEGRTLSKLWEKVAPRELQGNAAPWFWLASPLIIFDHLGPVSRGGYWGWDGVSREVSRPVPVVRSGPARR